MEMDVDKTWYYKAKSGMKELQGAQLAKMDLQGFNLKDTNLTQADLTETDLQWADLRGADLTDAVITNAKMNQTRINRHTKGDVELMKQLGALMTEERG